MSKERELFIKYLKDQLNTDRLTPLQWDGIMRAFDSFLSSRPEEKEEKRYKEFNVGDDINDVLNFIDGATSDCMIFKDDERPVVRYVFDRLVKITVEFNPNNQ